MKSGCAGATGLALLSSPTTTLRQELRVGRLTDDGLFSTLVLPAMQTFSSWILREACLASSPANHRAMWCQVGPATDAGFILLQTALAEMRYGRCLRQVEQRCK